MYQNKSSVSKPSEIAISKKQFNQDINFLVVDYDNDLDSPADVNNDRLGTE